MGQQEANSLVEKANALHNAGSKLEAAPLYMEAVRAFPAYGTFALVAGDSYLEGGKYDEAVDAYRTCLADMPDHDQAWLGLGKALLKVGKHEEAREAYGHANVAFPLDTRKGCWPFG
jgi:tetratricopeptide (TPR) repeat protein